MSTIKQISENPSANAVNAPHDPKLLQEQINRKMALYGVVQAFREGRYPSNRQISETLDYALTHEPVNVNKLSKEGKMLVQDFRNIIRTSKRMVERNNEDELFQNFLWHTRDVDYSKGNLKDVDTPVGKGDLKDDGEQAVEHLRTLGKLIFTNSEARKLLKDIGILGRDVAADAAAKVSDVARPDDDQLAKVDEPAPSNQWIGPAGEKRSQHDSVPDTGLAAKKEQAKDKKEQLKNDAQSEAEASKNRVQGTADSAQNGQQTDEDRANAAANAGKDQVYEEKETKKNQLLNKIPDEHKDKAKEQLNKAKDYAKDKFPEERRQRFIYRLKKVIVENQRHKDYQEAIEFFIDRAETYHGHSKELAGQTGGKALDVRHDESFQAAENELRTLLERFANGQSMQPIFDAVDQLYTDANNDDDLRQWFSELDSYLRRVLQEPGYIMKDTSDKEGQRLWDQGKAFWDPEDGKYAVHKDAFFDSVESFFHGYAEDALNVQLGSDVKKITKSLLMDADGNLKYKPHLWTDIREVILPTFAKEIGLIPIPRIEYTDEKVDIVIENLALESQNLLPNVIELEARNYFKMSPYDSIKDQSKHSFWLSFSQIQCDIKQIAYHIKKKSGFPKLTDSGFADVIISGKGISGKVHLESTGRKDHAFKLVQVQIKIDKLKFAVRESKFSFIIATLRPLVTGLIKKAVAKAIEEGIRTGLVQVDAQLADIKERYHDAKEQDGLSQIDALKQVITKKKEEGEATKEKAKEKTPSGEFKISATREDRLVDWSSPDSLVMKEGAAKDAARTSTGTWKSPAFDIVGKHAGPNSPAGIAQSARNNAGTNAGTNGTH